MRKLETLSKIIKEHGLSNFLRFVKYRLVLKGINFLTRFIRFDVQRDPTNLLFDTFVNEANRLTRPRILELGSRNISHKHLFTSYSEYVGFDINPGNNVDVVGDIHRISEYFQAEYFDAVYCISVFEHLAMPWKAVQEINKILKKDGILFIFTHPTFPLHAEPWDFWRFSKYSFSVLFNEQTGYKIISCVHGLPCVVLPLEKSDATRLTHRVLSFMGVTVWARKTRECNPSLAWEMKTEDVIRSTYPLEYFDEARNVFFNYLQERSKTKSDGS